MKPIRVLIEQLFCNHDYWPLPITGTERSKAGVMCRECFKKSTLYVSDMSKMAQEVYWSGHREWERRNKKLIKDMGDDLL